MSKKLDRYEFIWKAIQKHGYKYDYRKVSYIDSKTKVCIICPEHGEFLVSPNNHIRYRGCPICKCNKLKNFHSKKNDTFYEECLLINSRYDYSKVNYINNYTKVCIICEEHGEFYQTPNSHLQGSGCPICNESKLEKEIAFFLEENDIKYEYQKRFSWLGRQSLDFYLPNYNIAIECQGEQHYRPVDFANKGDEWAKKAFLQISKNDYNKKRKLIENNIELIYYTKPELQQINEFTNKKDLLTYIKNKNERTRNFSNNNGY